MPRSSLRFTAGDWDRVERDTMAWWAGDLERPLVHVSRADGRAIGPSLRFLSNYGFDVPANDLLDLYAPSLGEVNFYGDAFPAWWVNFGPGIMAGFLGSEVHSVSDPSETVWFSPAGELEIADLEARFDPDGVWWKRVLDLTQHMVDRWQGMLAVGHTDLGGNLDILASLCSTEALLFSVLDHPEEVDRLVARITELWVELYGRLDAVIRPCCPGTTCWAPIWSTGKTYMLQCDFAYMISPGMFERFAVPDLTSCCAYLDHGFYHLDGKGQIPHLDLLLSIERLRGIQWVPGDGQPPPEQWLGLLKRIRDGGKLCQLFVSPQGARTIVKNLGGKGFLFAVGSTPAFADPEQVDAFLDLLALEDISLNA